MGSPDINLELTYSSTTAAEFPNPGTTVQVGGKKYCCVYNAGADAVAAGDVCSPFLTTPAPGHISVAAATMTDGTDATTTTGVFAGVGIGAIATLAYGWIQVAGWCTLITTDLGVAAGDIIVMDGGTTVGKVVDSAAAADMGMHCGVCPAADASTVGQAWLMNSVFNY